MKILYLNHYAGSPSYGMEYRPFYMAREWVRAGHDVRIVAADRSHIRAVTPALDQKSRMDEVIDGVNYSWLKTPAYAGNGFGRVKNMASFVVQLYAGAADWARSERPDVVIASSTYPMDIWAAKRIANIAKAKLVFEVHDLWPLSPIELGNMSRWHPFIMMVQAAEDYAYRHSDIVVSMLPNVREYMVSRGMKPEKLRIVPNGIDPDEWLEGSETLNLDVSKIFSELRAQGKAIVGYAGTHGVANALDAFIDAAKLIKDDKVVFVLVGGGPDKLALQERVQAEGVKNVVFVPPVKKTQIPELLKFFDIAYIGLQRQPLFRFGIAPNKLMDYMMAARPVLMAIDAGNDPVRDAGCGLTVEPENPQAIAQGVKQLLSRSKDERVEIGAKGRSYILDHHTYPVLAKKFLDTFL